MRDVTMRDLLKAMISDELRQVWKRGVLIGAIAAVVIHIEFLLFERFLGMERLLAHNVFILSAPVLSPLGLAAALRWKKRIDAQTPTRNSDYKEGS